MLDPILNFPITSAWVMAMRLGFALLAGLVVGLERAWSNQPAGMRTHMILALGACGVMLLSQLIPLRFANAAMGGDPGRMAAQVISGIGFLGGGAILKFGFNVRGLTTAASIWTISVVGLVFGAGFYLLGLIMTVLLFFNLHVMERIEDLFLVRQDMRIITVIFDSRNLVIKDITKAVRDAVAVKKIAIEEVVDTSETEIQIVCRIPETQSIRKIFDMIKNKGPVKRIKID
ncbi:putative Mg2+ transporter-C (MgtC) family protein [Alkalispirochaeta americana]|uniref:Putative Mg2+ transporter-C (MgtC) family protein n=2 Tax=Alkalispirochaeta americana TaxID=159291 RepID=A0A1N6S2Z7_9SPIO|nr:putative Mg2+ transporter-C (MgtC) family protein [Alkalispirochaeta americana]